ncbi:MAG: hypothetical protein ACT4NT_03060 [Nitrososphaerota archaeon]
MSKITQKQKTSNTDDFSKEESEVLGKYKAGKLRFKKFKNAKDAIDDLHS